MKSIFRKSAIGLAILGLAGSSYAGTVTGAFFGVDGVDLQPRNGDLDFVAVFPSTTPGVVSISSTHPSYAWGFRLYGGLNFCGNEDLTISWLRYHTNDHEDFGSPLTVRNGINSSDVRFFEINDWSNIFANTSFKLDEVYGVFGHTTHFGPWAFRFAGGAEWARLDTTYDVSAFLPAVPVQPGPVPVPDITSEYDFTGKTQGFGPRVEFDMTYGLPYGLDIFARTNLALLIAFRHLDLDAADPATSLLDDFEFDKHRAIVPKAGIKLGIGYTYGFGMGGEGSCEETSLTLEAGWQTDIYIHMIERPIGFGNSSLSNGATTNASGNYTTKVSNFGTEGFFIGAKLSTGMF